MKRSVATCRTSKPELKVCDFNHDVAARKGVKYLSIVSIFFLAIFTSIALASERSAADELMELEKFRFNESEDISSRSRLRVGRMMWKVHHLVWEIVKEVKGNKTDELLELEKFRFNESEDISSRNRLRVGRMIWKVHHLAWEIVKDLKQHEEKRMTPCSGTDGT